MSDPSPRDHAGAVALPLDPAEARASLRLRTRGVLLVGGIVLGVLLRWGLGLPVRGLYFLLLVGWYAAAWAFARFLPADPIDPDLRRRGAYFAGEVVVAVAAAWLLGAGAWLAVVLLFLPVVEWNLLHPGRAGRTGTALALALAGVAMTAEAAGWIPAGGWLPAAAGTGAAVGTGLVAALMLVLLAGVAARFARASRAKSEALETLNTRLREVTGDLEGSRDELEEAYQRLQGTQAELVSAAKLATLGNLIRGVAHEINTPLGALSSNYDVTRRALGRLQVILADEVVDEDELEEVRKIVKAVDGVETTNAMAVDRMKALVRSLKTFGRPDRSEIDRVDLHEALESTLQLLRHELGDRIEVAKEFGDLPLVECYAHQVNQVFMNLLVNAVHAIPDEGRITIRTRTATDGVVVEVEDTGVGIGEEDLERIFEPGFTTKGTRMGMGLGLLISSQIVERHGGEISVESAVGEGTTFTVELPLRLPPRAVGRETDGAEAGARKTNVAGSAHEDAG